MKTFKLWTDYRTFSFNVRRNNRYIYNQATEAFLEAVIDTSKKREASILKGAVLYRAQCGCERRPVYDDAGSEIGDEEWPYTEDRMVPVKGKSFEGRANPRGITYLYLFNDKNTACAEVRPWKGVCISVAQFLVKRDLKVIDCSKIPGGTPVFLEEPDPETMERRVWADINMAFSQPVSPHDPETEYIPTQIVAEGFRETGFDGVAYKSSYEAGLNIVLFDLEAVEMLNCSLSKVKDMKFDFDHMNKGFSCRKGKKTS